MYLHIKICHAWCYLQICNNEEFLMRFFYKVCRLYFLTSVLLFLEQSLTVIKVFDFAYKPFKFYLNSNLK